jgi:hypothetical protein
MVGINLDSSFCEIVLHICAASFIAGIQEESENRSEIIILLFSGYRVHIS